jgi:hypothetical protein
MQLLLLVFGCLIGNCRGWSIRSAPGRQQLRSCSEFSLFAYYDESSGSGPSDYDSDDLAPATKQATVDDQVEDDVIRDALKRELLLYASVTNRGEYSSVDEQVRRQLALNILTKRNSHIHVFHFVEHSRRSSCSIGSA